MCSNFAKRFALFTLAHRALSATVCLFAFVAGAQDLPAAGDGRHLWLLESVSSEGEEEKPAIAIYHDADAANDRLVNALAPIQGELMPRGFAAGEGYLLVVMADRRVIKFRPSVSQLTGQWDFSRHELPALPEGVSLRSLGITQAGAWALVRVESPVTLEQLTRRDRGRTKPEGVDSFRFKSILGLPPGVDLSGPSEPAQDKPAQDKEAEGPVPAEDSEPGTDDAADASDADAAQPDEPVGESAESAEPQDAEATNDGYADASESESSDENESEPESEPELFQPVYRLIHVERIQWVAVDLPDDFGQPQRAELVASDGGERPTLVVQQNTIRSTPILIYQPRPQADGEADAWNRKSYSVIGLRQWDIARVDGVLVLGEQYRRGDDVVEVGLSVLRGDRVSWIGRLSVPTDGAARWRLVSLAGRAAVVTMPGPALQPLPDGQLSEPALAGVHTMDLRGNVQESVRPVFVRETSRLDQNADWILQSVVYLLALALMILFWTRTPGDEQLNLPEGVEIASIDKRIISGVIDLMPGFIIASAIFNVSWLEIVMLWPGTPSPKTLPAMRPGLLVIGVTVVLATVMELITARSLGKWLTGIYVSDFNGIPAPPLPSAVRAILRVLDLVALLLLIIPLISPTRQRLGDILARTVVVSREPDPEEERKKQEQRDREREDNEF